MELRHIRYFIALAEHLSFTQAAEKVHVTQSTLSHQIRQLEEELACTLFERKGKRVALTEKGEEFLQYAQNSLRQVEDGVKAIRTNSGDLHGAITIGTTHTFNMRVIPRSIAAFLERHPTISVKVLEMSGDAVSEALMRGELDFGITYKPDDTSSLTFEPLYNEQMVLIVGQHHLFAKRRFIRMAELHRQPLILLSPSFATRALLEECFHMADIEPIVTVEMNAVAPMIELVNMVNAATIVSEYAVPSHIDRVIRLQSPTPIRTPGLLWRRNATRAAAARHLAGIIREIVAKPQ